MCRRCRVWFSIRLATLNGSILPSLWKYIHMIYIYIYMHTYIYIYPRLHLCECSVQCEECVCICIIMFKELPFPWIVYPHCWLILPCMRFSWLFHVTFINIYESNILSVCMDIYMHIHIEGLVFQITHLHCLETITSLFYYSCTYRFMQHFWVAFIFSFRKSRRSNWISKYF